MAVKTKINVPISGTMTTVHPETEPDQVVGLSTTYAKLVSPAFTGTPTAPTQTSSDNSTKIATTAFVKTAVSSVTGANTSLSNLTTTGENHFLGSNNFKIIYPNGGSASSPANVAINSRYVETNPFAGYVVKCVAEFQYNGSWYESPWDSPYTGSQGSMAMGIFASQVGSNIIVNTGKHLYYYHTSNVYQPNITGANSTFNVTTAPCRVKVWKIGKI